ncbi:hypothetical protein EIN_391490 [Entamoeba invadens IP1]|uniref:Uncharacterized protein n=1 Tax=Entamoeba invadens IP1 TaxID=370355 RepID=A0A0A1U5C1_ENTIV|nr:hypothetical protein EIN_391490 [Entamoeba invadens IP1]ELP89494.1 hypothetical protein EIN_391490 [Entamoeba invadens IP1]|eukprot:XP_004256265.1 hypothetical protein EIN_391490 [Entamoeba invadens IP1]
MEWINVDIVNPGTVSAFTEYYREFVCGTYTPVPSEEITIPENIYMMMNEKLCCKNLGWAIYTEQELYKNLVKLTHNKFRITVFFQYERMMYRAFDLFAKGVNLVQSLTTNKYTHDGLKHYFDALVATSIFGRIVKSRAIKAYRYIEQECSVGHIIWYLSVFLGNCSRINSIVDDRCRACLEMYREIGFNLVVEKLVEQSEYIAVISQNVGFVTENFQVIRKTIEKGNAVEFSSFEQMLRTMESTSKSTKGIKDDKFHTNKSDLRPKDFTRSKPNQKPQAQKIEKPKKAHIALKKNTKEKKEVTKPKPAGANKVVCNIITKTSKLQSKSKKGSDSKVDKLLMTL